VQKRASRDLTPIFPEAVSTKLANAFPLSHVGAKIKVSFQPKGALLRIHKPRSCDDLPFLARDQLGRMLIEFIEAFGTLFLVEDTAPEIERRRS